MRGRDDALIVAAAIVPLALFLAAERRIAGAAGLPLDDAWIHLHFARNLAEGLGFVYNPGTPVAGSTAPLWTLLLGVGASVAGASVILTKTLGALTVVAAGLVTRRAALAWGAAPAAALVAGVALLWTGAFAWGALSGMEVGLAALLVAAALWAHARDRLGTTTLLVALATLARPESALLLPLIVAARPLTVRRAALAAAITLAVLAPAVAFSLATTGALVPAAATAKVEGGLLGWLAGAREPARRLLLGRPWEYVAEWARWLFATHWALPFALVPALVLAWRRAGRALGLPALVLLAHPLGMALLAPYRGPAFQEGRYSMHLLPVAFVVLAVALSQLQTVAAKGGVWRAISGPPMSFKDLATARSPARPGGVVGRTVLIAYLAYLALALVSLPAAAARYAWAVQNINAMQVEIGRWIAVNTPRNARLAVNDVGAIAYISRRPVLDLMGLVTPEVVPYRRQGEDGVIRYVTERCPDYVVVFPAWFPRLSARTDLLEPVHRVRLDRWEVTGGPEMVVYRLRRCAV
ncbi:MAG: hypothetical protein ACRELS_06985 [Candidatus Rokuibacteriota bacterium]